MTLECYQLAGAPTCFRSIDWAFQQAHDASSPAPSLGSSFSQPPKSPIPNNYGAAKCSYSVYDSVCTITKYCYKSSAQPFHLLWEIWSIFSMKCELEVWGPTYILVCTARIHTGTCKYCHSAIPHSCQLSSSVQSFYVQNLINNNLRNRLQPTRVNKLTFLYLNRHVLDRKPSEKDQWQQLSRAEEFEREDEVLDLGPAQQAESMEVEEVEAIRGISFFFRIPSRFY